MNKDEISNIISDINDEFIEEAALPTRRKTVVFRYISVAACVCVVALSAFLLYNSGFFDPKTPEQGQNGEKNVMEQAGNYTVDTPAIGAPEIMTEIAIGGDTSGEMAVIPQWTDLAVPMKYTEIKKDDISYYTTNCSIPSESIDVIFFETEMHGYDIYTDTDYSVWAEVYSIKGINTICAVAAKIDNGNEYYVYVNTEYTPDTLGDMIKDLNLKETLSFGKAYSDYSDSTRYTNRTYEDFDDSIVWNMLLPDESVKNVSYDRYYETIAHISVDIPILGYTNIHLGATKDGYLITNIMGTQKCFFIGKDKTEAFRAYLENNVKYTENTVVYVNPDGTVPYKTGPGASGQSTPGYNPDDPQSVPPATPDYYVPGYETTPPYSPDDTVCTSVDSGNVSSGTSSSSDSTCSPGLPVYPDYIVEETTGR